MLPKKSAWGFIFGLLSLLALLVLVSGAPAQAPASAQDDEGLLREFRWRNLGPANFAGRVVDVEALDSDFSYVICASASGGVWKSTNAGTTWTPIFDDYATGSIGDVALFQKDANLIWVGTGEANNRNSVGWGDGIYKSADGGKTFSRMGLTDTYQIARIVTHPVDPNVVYVAAIGNLWAYEGERGVFKTLDGGKTWTKLAGGLPDDGKTGAIDLVMDPSDPETLYAAFYQRLRRPWRFDSGGPNGGIFKTTNGGRTWTKLAQGLPTGETGRIGLAVYRKNPKIVMAIIEHGFQPREDNPDYYDMSKLGTGVYRSEDGGRTWKFLNRYNNRPFYYSQIRINPLDDQRVYVLTTDFMQSSDGGKTFRPAPLSFEGGLDFHAMWLDPTNKDRYYLGKDKGLTLTMDHGAHFLLFDNMPVAQFYALGVDYRDPYTVCGGTQDNGTWCGPSFSKDVRGTQNDSWWKLHWGDGMFIQLDPTDWRKAYTEAENGSFRRYDMETRRVVPSRPSAENIVNYRERFPNEERSGAAARQFRFNWRAPLVMSPNNPQTLYLGGNFLFATYDGGEHWKIISPDLSTNDRAKWDLEKPGGLTRDATGAETHCSVTAISESPLMPGVIWTGTDDGNVQVTRDGGATWTNVRAKIPDVPEGLWVSSVEASHFTPGTAFVTFDGHRSSDFRSWLFKTTDYGATWTNLSAGFPQRQSAASPHGHSLYVVREGLKNPNLLFAGSEFVIFISMDGGATWKYFINGLPTVAVQDIVIHPRDEDLIIGTHGRGIYILDDITPLEQFTAEVRNAPAHLFAQRSATIWEDASRGGTRGHFFFAAENPPYIPKRDDVVRAKLINGALITYYLKSAGDVRMEVSDITGAHKRTLRVPGEPGIHRALWDLTFDPAPEQVQRFATRMTQLLDRIEKLPQLTSSQKELVVWARKELRDAGDDDARLNAVREKLQDEFGEISVLGSFGGPLAGAAVEPGEYLVRMTASGKTYTTTLRVRPDPILKESGR